MTFSKAKHKMQVFAFCVRKYSYMLSPKSDICKGNHDVVIWKFLEYASGDYIVNQYFTNSDSTWWTTHNQGIPLGHPRH